jgi:hypothetical protein
MWGSVRAGCPPADPEPAAGQVATALAPAARAYVMAAEPNSGCFRTKSTIVGA